MAKLTRFMVRRRTNEAWIWTPELAKRKDMEEVFAADTKSALEIDGMPEATEISLSQVHGMSKDQLVKFAEVKLGLKLDPEKQKDELRDQVKEAIFMRPVDETIAEVQIDTTKKADPKPAVAPAKRETRPLTPGQARAKAGA